MAQAQFIYPTEARFNIPHLIAGMNAFYVTEKLVSPEAEVYDLVVVGQHKPEGNPAEEAVEGTNPLRLLILYRHTPSNTIGVQAIDVSYRLLNDLELVGTPSAD